MPYMTPRETARYRSLRQTGTVALALAILVLLIILPAVGSFGGFSGWIWLLSGIAVALLAVAGLLFRLAETLTLPAPPEDNFHVVRLPAARLGVHRYDARALEEE